MGVHQLDQPGFAVNDVAVRDPRLNDLVPAGDCVRQMDNTVGISGIGAGLVAGIGGIVAIAQVPDGGFYSSPPLAGGRNTRMVVYSASFLSRAVSPFVLS